MSAAFSDLGVGPNKHYSVLWKLYTFSESHPRYLGHSIYFMLNYLQVEKLAWRFKVTVMLARLLCDCLTKPRALTSKNIIHMYKLLKDQPMQFGYFFGGGCNFIAKWNRFWPLMWPYCRVGQVSATHVAILQSGTGFGHSCGHLQDGSDDRTQTSLNHCMQTRFNYVLYSCPYNPEDGSVEWSKHVSDHFAIKLHAQKPKHCICWCINNLCI